MKKYIIIILTVLLILTATPCRASVKHPGLSVKVTHNHDTYTARIYYYNCYVVKYKFDRRPVIKYVTTDKLTRRQLTHRKNRALIIEVVTGTVTDHKGNGRVDTKSKYNYINYSRVEGANKGDRVRTYEIYHPYNNYEDDIAIRLDQLMK